MATPFPPRTWVRVMQSTSLIPDVMDNKHTLWPSVWIGAESVVQIAEPKRSPVTDDYAEPYVRWITPKGDIVYGWLAATAVLSNQQVPSKLVFMRVGLDALSAWARLRHALYQVRDKTHTFRHWLRRKRWTVNETLALAMIIREFGGRATPSDPIDVLVQRARARILPHFQELNMATKKTGKKTAPKTAKGKAKTTVAHVGRKSRLDGCTFKKTTKENPRRKGSVAWKAWNVLKTGMSYAEYMKAGGERASLVWDIKHGFVKVIKKAA